MTPQCIFDRLALLETSASHGTNSSEVQGIAEAEDKGWRARLIFAILNGHTLRPGNADSLTSLFSLLTMDSRGCYDLLVSNKSLAMSMTDPKARIELFHVQQGIRIGSLQTSIW